MMASPRLTARAEDAAAAGNNNSTSMEEVADEQQSQCQSHQQMHHEQETRGVKSMKGRWTRGEHDKFLLGLDCFGKDWKKISTLVRTRSIVQIRTHAQKYFKKTDKGRSFPDQPYLVTNDDPTGDSSGFNASGSDSESHSATQNCAIPTTPAANKRGKTLWGLRKAVALAAPRAARSSTTATAAAATPVPAPAASFATESCKDSAGSNCNIGSGSGPSLVEKERCSADMIAGNDGNETMLGSTESNVSNGGMPQALTDNIWAQLFCEIDACKPTASPSCSSPDIEGSAEGSECLAASLNFPPASIPPLEDVKIGDRRHPFSSNVTTSPHPMGYNRGINAFTGGGDGCSALPPVVTPTAAVDGSTDTSSVTPLVTLPGMISLDSEAFGGGGSGSGIGSGILDDVMNPVYPKPEWRWPILSTSSADQSAIRHGGSGLGMRTVEPPPQQLDLFRRTAGAVTSLPSKGSLSAGGQQAVPSNASFTSGWKDHTFCGEARQLKRIRCGMMIQGSLHGKWLKNNIGIRRGIGGGGGDASRGGGYSNVASLLFEDHLGML